MVGGSDLVKQREQLGEGGTSATRRTYGTRLRVERAVGVKSFTPLLTRRVLGIQRPAARIACLRAQCDGHCQPCPTPTPATVLDMFDYVFPENGLLAYKAGKVIGSTVRRGHLARYCVRSACKSEQRVCHLLSAPLRPSAVIPRVPGRGAPEGVHQLRAGVLVDAGHPDQGALGSAWCQQRDGENASTTPRPHSPSQRGTFIEFRNGMLNISPIGATTSCSV